AADISPLSLHDALPIWSFQVIQAQALGRNASIEQYNAWIARYPQEPGLYGRYFEFLLYEKDFKAAADLIAKYHAKFPDDEVSCRSEEHTSELQSPDHLV